MSWLQLDDNFATHPKVRGLSDAAFRLHVAALCDCKRFQTDGHVKATAVDDLTRHTSKTDLIAELIAAGLWEVSEAGGWEIHDFLEWNHSKADLERLHEKRQSSGRMGYQAKSKQVLKQTPSKSQALAEQVLKQRVLVEVSGSEIQSEEEPDQPVRSEDPLSPAERERVQRISSRPPPPPARDDVVDVLEHWAARLYPDRRVKFDDKRRKRVKARLADGFTVEQLKLAVDGAMRDDWLMGRRDGSPKDGYRDVHTVLRDVAQVERLLGLTKQGAATLAKRPRNDDPVSVDPQVATGIRSLVREAPGETPLSLDDQRKRAASLSEMFKAIGTGGVK